MIRTKGVDEDDDDVWSGRGIRCRLGRTVARNREKSQPDTEKRTKRQMIHSGNVTQMLLEYPHLGSGAVRMSDAQAAMIAP